MADVGVRVNEGVAKGTSTLATISKRNIAVFGLFQRGVENVPTIVKSYSQFKRIFGNNVTSFYGPSFVKSIFDEAGDADVILNIVRIVPGDAAAATCSNGITAGYCGSAVKGEFGNHIAVKYDTAKKLLNVYYDEEEPSATDKSPIVESYSGATIADIAASVNSSSAYITITDSSKVTSGTLIKLTGGKNGTASRSVTSSDLDLIKATDTQIVTISDGVTSGVATILDTWLSEDKRRVGVITMPLPSTDSATAILTDAKTWYDALHKKKESYIAVYNTWVEVYDESYNPILIPGAGAIIGAAYLRNAFVQGDGIHIPPGGTDGAFQTVIKVLPSYLDQDDINTIVQDYHVNVVTYDNNFGNFVISSRTMSDNSLYMSVHIRLMTIYYLANLKQMAMPYIQKPNTPELRKDLITDIRNFFKGEYNSGALERSISFDKACIIVSNSDNNPPKQDRKLLNVDVNFVPTECTESIKLSLLRNDSILTAEEK